MKDDKSTILDVISGNESLKFDISLDMKSIGYLAAGAVAVGVVLILISKEIKILLPQIFHIILAYNGGWVSFSLMVPIDYPPFYQRCNIKAAWV